MVVAKADSGQAQIYQLSGTTTDIVGDVGTIAHNSILMMATDGARSKEEVCIRYGAIARMLVDFIEHTVLHIDEMI